MVDHTGLSPLEDARYGTVHHARAGLRGTERASVIRGADIARSRADDKSEQAVPERGPRTKREACPTLERLQGSRARVTQALLNVP